MRQARHWIGWYARVGEMARYGVVGVALVAIEYAIYAAIVHIWPEAAVPAGLLARTVACVAGLVGHARFSFSEAGLSTRTGLRYVLVVAINMGFASLLLAATVPLLGPLFAKVASDVVTIAVAYLLGRHVVFLAPRREAAR